MPRNLIITVRLHDGRYHGTGDRPPAPARLFQALVAGAGVGGSLGGEESEALQWLEKREPPVIAAPLMRNGQSVKTAVPNNDTDSLGGDLDRVSDIRAFKTIEPKLFDAAMPFLYVWDLGDTEDEARPAQTICTLAERLYQLGRGVDMAWAWGEVIDSDELELRLSSYPGPVYRPSGSGNGKVLACPQPGSLASLVARYAASSRRFTTEGQGKAAKQLFTQPPKPRFAQVAYESPPSRRVYELREPSREAPFCAWPLARASKLVVWLRDGAAHRLREALPHRSAEIEQVLIGRKADGADAAPTASRVRIIPLPSIGHQHADHGIRRVLVEVPADCLLRAQDVHWAFSGLELSDPDTGEVMDSLLTPAGDERMLSHYGMTEHAGSCVWRTVTPAALPETAKRRRINPARTAAEAKGGAERAAEQTRAAAAVAHALRHAQVRPRAEQIRVQREPFEAKGERVEAFAQETRFAKERLWHVELVFNTPVAGPLVIGDGRFLGLGVMAPVQQSQGLYAFDIEDGLVATPQPAEIARALRRAVMARVQQTLGERAYLPTFFTGHERDGSPAQTEHNAHLSFVFAPEPARLLIIAPHVVERRAPTNKETQHLENLKKALAEFHELRAGAAGRLMLRASVIDAAADSLFAASRTWESVTPYQVTRHAKQVGADEALAADLRAECRRRGLPEPRVTTRELRGVPGVGLVGSARLTFEVAVAGPIILGKSRHLGGGLFGAVEL